MTVLESKILKEAELNGFQVQIMHDPAHYVEVNLEMASDSKSSLSNVDNWNWIERDFDSSSIRYHVAGVINGKVVSRDNLKEVEVFPVLLKWNEKQGAFREKLRKSAELLLEDFKLDYGNSEVEWEKLQFDDEFVYKLCVTHEAPHKSTTSFEINFDQFFLEKTYDNALKVLVNAVEDHLLEESPYDINGQQHTMQEMTSFEEFVDYREDCNFFSDKYYEIIDKYINIKRVIEKGNKK